MKLKSLVWLFFLMMVRAMVCCGQGLYDTTITPADAMQRQYVPLLKHKRVALVINQTSVVGDESLLDILLKKKINVVKIFVPEHGFRGVEDAGSTIENTIDSATQLPVISLYGKHKKPKPEDLENIDVVVYDLQDVGVRFYTYISTMEYCMESCAENNKTFMVLDRPDPNGFYIDGPVLDTGNRSFVGMQPIPIVYGMTAGEYAQMLVGERWLTGAKELDLKVIKCAHYDHAKKYKLPVAPSPNLKTMAAVYAYPSLCLFEGTVVSVGRGTDIPFQQYGCPEFESKFAYSFKPEPTAGAKNPPYKDKACYGEIVGTDAAEILTHIDNQIQIKWLLTAWNAYPDKEHFFNSFFVKLAGTNILQQQLKEGASAAQIHASWQAGIDEFKKIRKKYLLYGDY